VLSSDLVRARVVENRISAAYVDAERPAIRTLAEDVLACFTAAVEGRWRRAEIDAALVDAIGDAREHKVAKGFAKLLFDRSQFETSATIAPAEARLRLFRRARELGGVSLEPGPWARPVAADVLAQVGAELGVGADELSSSMYADMREEERIVSMAPTDVGALVDRYHLALVQSLLLHATSLTVTLDAPTRPRLRQLLRWVKFHQILFNASRTESGIRLQLDGPTSIFSQSSRYGMQLAMLLPAVLLQERWRVEATILWTKAEVRKQLVIGPEDGLRTEKRDDGAYETREQLAFLERFPASAGPWQIAWGDTPMDLGGQGVLLPDFQFTDGERVGYLEIVGFWRRDWLMKRIELLRRYGPPNLVLAVSRKLKVDKDQMDLPQQVVEFSEIVPPKAVRAALELVARPIS
jgi:predicted nuclease of restriction endonuclease-like RecB superfamily